MNQHDLPPLPQPDHIRYDGPDSPTRPARVVIWVFPSGVGVSLVENQRDHAYSFGVFMTGSGTPHPQIPDLLYSKRRLTGLDNEETGPPFAPYWHHIPFPGVTPECRARFEKKLKTWLDRVRNITPSELLP